MLPDFRTTIKFACCGWLVAGVASAIAATPTAHGQSGYVNMPSAWTERDGTLSTGYSYDSPYGTYWADATVLPFLQIGGRYVSITGIPGFTSVPGQYGSNYGRYKDKVVDAKINLTSESEWLPAISVGATDLFGTELFKGQYVVASKVFGSARNVEASIGYGKRRPDGAFAGLRWAPVSTPGWAVVAEYDGNDYKKDYWSSRTAAGEHTKGPAVGVEYRWGWLGAQIARHRDRFSANLFVSLPLGEHEFVPKFLEPAWIQPKDVPASVGMDEWRSTGRDVALVQSLVGQDFRNVRLELDGDTLRLALTNQRISEMGRAVGRAARTALAFAPRGTRTLVITYTRLEQPVATYEFLDVRALTDYFTGLINRDAFLQTVAVRYANPADALGNDQHGMLAALQTGEALGVQVGRDGEIVQLRSEDPEANRFKLAPKLGFFFNDPSGALRYDLAASGTYDRRLHNGLYLNSAFKLDLLENVSGVTQKSNSLLPHVRSDVAEYMRGGRFKLNRLMLSQYLPLDERVYARLSSGFYEEMYRGAGGQILYLPKDSRWAVDLTVDALQQRGYRGWFDKRNYQTVTALGALHYRVPYDITATVRAGRFLARDKGARLEFKRRFASGVELGVWYTKTNGHDITNPGSPTNPYNDKGFFVSVPLNMMLPNDTQATAGMSISPWTRDVGQMVNSPGDLYELMEQPRRTLTYEDGLGNLAERPDEKQSPAVNPMMRPAPDIWPQFRQRIEQSATTTPDLPEPARALAVGGAVAAGALLLDKPVNRFFASHQQNRLVRAWANAGKATPLLLTAAAGGAVAFGDVRDQNMGLIALESVAGAAILSETSKRVVSRARPTDDLGPWKRSANKSDSSFPSNHSVVAFAAVTPFAKEYDAPWLYAVASAGSFGRVAGRQHWVSDVVAGGALGFAVASWTWQAQRANTSSRLAIAPGDKEIRAAWSGTF